MVSENFSDAELNGSSIIGSKMSSFRIKNLFLTFLDIFVNGKKLFSNFCGYIFYTWVENLIFFMKFFIFLLKLKIFWLLKLLILIIVSIFILDLVLLLYLKILLFLSFIKTHYIGQNLLVIQWERSIVYSNTKS
jgi:hypothetical protein